MCLFWQSAGDLKLVVFSELAKALSVALSSAAEERNILLSSVAMPLPNDPN